jgi:hypothetical protein
MDLVKEVGIPALFLILGIIGWFLRSKDEAQAKQIALLFLKHDQDAEALAELKERIAREHYVKAELDTRFTRLEDAIKAMSHELGAKLDKLADAMVAHLSKGEK